MKYFLVFVFTGISVSIAQTSSIQRLIYFDSGESVIQTNDVRFLDSLSTIIKQKKEFRISIHAYCDATGDESSNLKLSERRAAAIAELLMKKGIDKARLNLFSLGESNPVADNETEAGKAKNRRALLTVSWPVVAEIKQVSTAANPQEGSMDLMHTQLQVGKTLVLKNLNFEGGTPILLPESEPVLKELLQLMKDNPTLEIEIGGHVCCGPDMPLSLARAKRVWRYLVGYGINEKRMSYKGYSFDKPLNAERTEEERILNRRVEITILKL